MVHTFTHTCVKYLRTMRPRNRQIYASIVDTCTHIRAQPVLGVFCSENIPWRRLPHKGVYAAHRMHTTLASLCIPRLLTCKPRESASLEFRTRSRGSSWRAGRAAATRSGSRLRALLGKRTSPSARCTPRTTSTGACQNEREG